MAYFITKAEVIAAAFARNIDEGKIQDELIEACGIRYLLPILGEDFYDAVVLTPASYVDLKVYLVPVLANYVKYEILPGIYAEISTAGINQFTGENKRSGVKEDLETLKQSAIEIALKHADKLYKFLEDNSDDYSLYVSGANPQSHVEIVGGIVFDKYPDDDDDYTNNET